MTRLEIENDNDRRKTTSGDRLNGDQSAAGNSSYRLLVDQTSTNVVVDLKPTQENIDHPCGKTDRMAEMEEVAVGASGTSAVDSGQPGSQPVDWNLQPAGMVQGSGVSVEGKGPSFEQVVTRRRRPGKSAAEILRRRTADRVQENKTKSAATW